MCAYIPKRGLEFIFDRYLAARRKRTTFIRHASNIGVQRRIYQVENMTPLAKLVVIIALVAVVVARKKINGGPALVRDEKLPEMPSGYRSTILYNSVSSVLNYLRTTILKTYKHNACFHRVMCHGWKLGDFERLSHPKTLGHL